MVGQYKSVYQKCAEEDEYVNKQLALDFVEFCLQCKKYGQRYAVNIPKIEALKHFPQDIADFYKKHQSLDALTVSGLTKPFKAYISLILEHGLDEAVKITAEYERTQGQIQREEAAKRRDSELERFARGTITAGSGKHPRALSDDGDSPSFANAVRILEENR